MKPRAIAGNADAAVEIRLLGPLSVTRGGQSVDLPPSRKARALLGYLVMSPNAVARSSLCDLLWEGVDDPRAELRWCLSRLRSVMGDSGRLIAREDAVRLDVSGCGVDAVALDEALGGAKAAEIAIDRCRILLGRFGGDFLQGLELEGSPRFSAWLTAQRLRYRQRHAELLERLATAAPDDEALHYLEQWRQLAPFDPAVHRALLAALARRGRVREAAEHLRAAVKLFEDEGLDASPLHAAWRAARVSGAGTEGIAIEPSAEPDATGRVTRRASVVVMPFSEDPASAVPGGTADALAYDIITRLAKLRSLFVIAQGTVFELKARGLAPAEAARVLDVDYVVGGAVRRDGVQLSVKAELIDARAGRVIWADEVNQRQADTLAVLDEIGNRIVASIAGEIEALERNRAVLKAPNSLDAWESHHRGLWHMYRFSRADNAQARQFFQRAVQLDPTFSRPYAGLSFTYFQGAFQGWEERAAAVEHALEAAGQSLMADDRDPAAHWALGRALWLRGRHDQCIAELEQSVDLSPNFAQAHYTLAFVQAQAGDPGAAIRSSDYSRSLSPFDPLLFGMLGARAMALVRMGNHAEAIVAAVQAAARPNAHIHIQAIAAFTLALADSPEEAESYARVIRQSNPSYTVADFFRAFRFDAHGIAAFRKGAKRLGMA